MPPFPEDLPKVGIFESMDSRKLELKDMTLTWVHI